MENLVILVDENDIPIGQGEKQEVHRNGQLHRALSIFIYNGRNEMLLQRRAKDKYHSGGLWTNACCTHPAPGEETASAADRRLRQEMGIHCLLFHSFSFIYKVELSNQMTEHEFDHVFVGKTEMIPKPDPSEVMEWKYLGQKEITAQIKTNPGDFTEWFKLILPQLKIMGL